MSWFKKLSQSNLGSQSEFVKQRKRCLSVPLKENDSCNDGTDQQISKKCLSSISSMNVEVVDPEIFFQDPDHVRNYREETQFLQLMSEWEIIGNPAANHTNFFSADFEDEYLQKRTPEESLNVKREIFSINNNENEQKMCTRSPELMLTIETTNQLKPKMYDLLFTNHIKMGIALPEIDSGKSNGMLSKRLKNRKRTTNFSAENLTGSSDNETWCYENFITILPEKRLPITCPRDIIRNCEIDRAKLKTEALACSIMGAIGKCPDKDSTSTIGSSEGELLTNTRVIDRCHPIRWKPHCDHYDIKQFFHLDDCGNILLNMNHIVEFKGHGFVAQSKRVYQRYRKECQCTEEDMLCQSRGCCFALKRLLCLLWHITIGHPRNKINPYSNYTGPGDTVRAYTLQLAQDQCSTFARNIENFISCTKESREAAPQVVMRNMRQFMNGMKNYLVKHGEGKFQQEVDEARGRLKSDEFLNLDAILETVMHQLVVLPLREHLYGMFVDYYTRSEDIQLLAQNVKYACGRSASDFGIRPSVTPPSTTSLTVISNLLLRLQEAELPLDKMDLFICVISTIFDATGCPRGQQLGADDFLPILVYVVAKCGFVGAEIEAEFMWGLLQPTLLNGETGYYLTALCSAVHVLKSFMASENESGSGSLDWRSSSLPACSSVLRVIIPDEYNGSLQTRTLPVRPHTTTREVCRIIAHKARITNPQDYALFKLVDGEETLLNDIECPQDIRLAAKGKHCMLAYKRIDAKIAWPTATQPMHN